MKTCDKYVIEHFWSGKQSVLKRFINSGKVDDIIIEYLKNRFDDTDNIYESLYRIKYGLNAAPKCPICGKPIHFTNGYNEYCSRVCANKNPKLIEHRQETILKKYGVTAVAKLDSVKQKMSDSWKNKSQDELDNIRNKKIKTTLEKYGVTCTLQSKEVRNKIKQTNVERYGFEYPAQAKEVKDKIKQTNLERYGVECVFYLEEYRDKEKHISPEARQKAVNTILERYGNDNYANREKVYETKKKNGSYVKSKEEDYVYNVLVDIYGKDNVERQYKSELYPFACDFYIIPKDLYIEYNGFWTHGFTPYIGSKENKIQLGDWKQKAITSKFYKNAIIIWTVSDVKKRNTAKSNNLNYIEFWKLEDVIDYIKQYKENI